ncbi:MAG: Zn-dependent hydrolase [Chloroflexi bacterium]|nr:Zn-dependent hydrolase [Chloroflexota bacterium]
MKIKFYAHASFRLEGQVQPDQPLSIVTDPYTPGPAASAFDPIAESADLVIMSSATDRFHSDPSHINGHPTVVNALEIPPAGLTVKNLYIQSIPSSESLTFDFGREPEDNAMYLFSLEGIRILHMGDIGNPLDNDQLGRLAGQVDLMFALTGGHATIALDDLEQAITFIQPRVIIPMHYQSSRGVLNILPVTDFTDRFPQNQVTFVGSPELQLTQDTLPDGPHIFVLEQSR